LSPVAFVASPAAVCTDSKFNYDTEVAVEDYTMDDWWYRRAEYDKEREVYVVRHEDGSEVVYSFMTIELDEDDPDTTLAIFKDWEDDEDGPMGEFYPFMILSDWMKSGLTSSPSG
jgi:hypothetical protein